jgi:hypothetical protein
MARFVSSGLVVAASGAVVLAVALCSPARTAAQTADADAHRAWMNDASDEQENYRFAVADKDMKAATEALVKIESLMAKTEDYWSAKKAADGVRLSKEARAHASQAATAVKAGNLAAAGEAFDRLSASCNACHDLHLEKR